MCWLAQTPPLSPARDRSLVHAGPTTGPTRHRRPSAGQRLVLPRQTWPFNGASRVHEAS
jgi:hypothetical protein